MVRSAALTASSSWRHRVRGSLLLAACGDALGAPFEGDKHVDVAEMDRWLADPSQTLRWSDDTASTMVVADHLIRRGGAVDEDELATELAAEWSRDPARRYGESAAGLLADLAAGQGWREASARLFDGQGSYGNGAAKRVAPVGLLPSLGLSAVAARARRIASVTHAHPLGQDGAAAQAVAVAALARTPESEPVDADRLLAAIGAQVQTEEFQAALRQVRTLHDVRARPEQVADTIGNGPTAVESVPAALVAFLNAPSHPREVMRFAVAIGGAADSIASMAGALVGAHLGEKDMPVVWGLRLEAVSRLWTVAEALAALSTVRA